MTQDNESQFPTKSLRDEATAITNNPDTKVGNQVGTGTVDNSLPPGVGVPNSNTNLGSDTDTSPNSPPVLNIDQGNPAAFSDPATMERLKEEQRNKIQWDESKPNEVFGNVANKVMEALTDPPEGSTPLDIGFNEDDEVAELSDGLISFDLGNDFVARMSMQPADGLRGPHLAYDLVDTSDTEMMETGKVHERNTQAFQWGNAYSLERTLTEMLRGAKRRADQLVQHKELADAAEEDTEDS